MLDLKAPILFKVEVFFERFWVGVCTRVQFNVYCGKSKIKVQCRSILAARATAVFTTRGAFYTQSEARASIGVTVTLAFTSYYLEQL